MAHIIDQTIRRAFSDAAEHYDVLTSLHKEIARELIAKIRGREETQTILDVGMGTGWMTGKLKFWFPESRIVGIDFSDGMIAEAKAKSEGSFDIVQAHGAKLPFTPESFDVVISNLAYQWVSDLGYAFSDVRRVLKPNGVACMTLFGHDTFRELFEALEQTAQGDQKAHFNRLLNFTEVTNFVNQSGLSEIETDYERIKVRFANLPDLLKWVKGIGANVLNQDVFIGKDWFTRASEYYENHFTDRLGAYATFEIIWIKGKK